MKQLLKKIILRVGVLGFNTVFISAMLFLANYGFVSDISVALIQSPPKLLCCVMTHKGNHERKAYHVKNTWGKRCDKLVFISNVDDPKLPSVKIDAQEGRKYIWRVVKGAFKYVYENHFDEADWFLKTDDDAFVVVENLKLILKNYDKARALHIGGMHFRPSDNGRFLGGGAGYILSKEALKRFAEKALLHPTKCSQRDKEEEEIELEKCLTNVGVEVIDARDRLGRFRFLYLELKRYLVPGLDNRTSYYWKYLPSPPKQGLECCSETAAGFHYINPREMYLLEYLLYTFSSPYELRLKKIKDPLAQNLRFIFEYKMEPLTRISSHKILCWIWSGLAHTSQINYVEKTWGKKCNKLLLLTSDMFVQEPLSKDDKSLMESNKTLQNVLRYLHDYHLESDWFVNVESKTFLVVENLRLELNNHNPNNPIYFKLGAGFILSKKALSQLALNARRDNCLGNNNQNIGTDIETCIINKDIYAYDLSNGIVNVNLMKIVTDTYKMKSTVGFQSISPEQMYVFEYLIYHLRPHNSASSLLTRFVCVILAFFILFLTDYLFIFT